MKGGGEKLYRKARRYLQLQSVFGFHLGLSHGMTMNALGGCRLRREEVEQNGGVDQLRPVLESSARLRGFE